MNRLIRAVTDSSDDSSDDSNDGFKAKDYRIITFPRVTRKSANKSQPNIPSMMT